MSSASLHTGNCPSPQQLDSSIRDPFSLSLSHCQGICMSQSGVVSAGGCSACGGAATTAASAEWSSAVCSCSPSRGRPADGVCAGARRGPAWHAVPVHYACSQQRRPRSTSPWRCMGTGVLHDLLPVLISAIHVEFVQWRQHFRLHLESYSCLCPVLPIHT